MNDRMMRMGVGSVVLLALALGATAGESGPSERNRSSVEPSLDKPPVATVNAREHGVVGNGQADDTETLQAALNAAEKKGPVCYLPAGQYRINGSLVVPAGVTLWGASGGVPHSEHPIGTVLLAYGGKGAADGAPLVTLKSNAVIRNLVIHYPEQTLPDVVPYPWTIRGDGELCQVLDLTITNPYQALDFGTRWNELHLIRNVFACPLKTGLYIDQCTDIGRVENVHFNPNFWTRMAFKPRYPGGDIKAYLARSWRPGQYKRWYLRAFQEEFDARLYPQGWAAPEFVPNHDWLSARVLDGPADKPSLAAGYGDYAQDIGAPLRGAELRTRSVPLLRETLIPVKQLTEQFLIEWLRPAEEYFECVPPNAFKAQAAAVAKETGPGVWQVDLDGSRAAALTFELQEQIVGWPYCFFMNVAGIQPLEPGFRRCAIRPQLGDLESLDLTAQTVRGPIHFHSQGPLGQRELAITLPAGCEGELVLPAGEQPGLEKLASLPTGLDRYRLPPGMSVRLTLRHG